MIVERRDRDTMRIILKETEEPPNGYGCMATPDQVRMEAEETWRRVRAIANDTLASIDRVVGHLAQMPGSRVLLLASSGFFGQTLEKQQQTVIDHAIHSGVVINALDSKGMYAEAPPGCRPGDPNPAKCMIDTGSFGAPSVLTETIALTERLMVVNTAMADMAHGTGGEFFHNNNDLHAGLRRLGAVEVVYHMSFRPEGVTAAFTS